MTILVQRQLRIAPADRFEFERQSREGFWPALLELGARMLAYGCWEFGGDDATVVTHTAYEDFAHWEATRASRTSAGATLAIDPLVAPLLEPSPDRGRFVSGSEARVIDVDDEASPLHVFYRRPGTEAAAPPPTFGKGSVVSERTYLLRPGSTPEFRQLSMQVWPWLEQCGGRLIAFGQDPLHTSDEVITLFAFRSLADWHRLSRPRADLEPPSEVVRAWNQRAGLIVSNQGRLLTVLTDFGTPARQ